MKKENVKPQYAMRKLELSNESQTMKAKRSSNERCCLLSSGNILWLEKGFDTVAGEGDYTRHVPGERRRAMEKKKNMMI